MQSCKTTQIAYYVIELCWYILEKDIPNLLDDFIVRSELEMEVRKMNNIQIFISYSEDSPYHIKKIERIVNYLEKEGYVVYFYAKAPLGTNNMEFMQKINKCDATIVIGTKKHKEKSTRNNEQEEHCFEAYVLSREFMNNNYEKIIPIAFDEFNESFPEPFAINKGMRVKRVDQRFLNNLSKELKNKF
ncbi:MAG: toll/interleukin-1 receptor domain-containing protein [Lachnospiraceae bacterium]